MLVSRTLSLAAFIMLLRSRLDIQHSSKALFLFVGDNILPTTLDIQTVYSRFADADGGLYITYMEQDVFG